MVPHPLLQKQNQMEKQSGQRLVDLNGRVPNQKVLP
jgi:hypothetical protein